MKNTIISTLLLTSLLVYSCHYEHDHTEEPAITTDIQISNPSTGSMYHNGDTVYLKASISSSGELHGYEVILQNVSADTIEFYTSGHTHGNSMNIDTFWVNSVKGHSDMKLDVTAIIDHEGNKSTKSVNFHCHPM